MHLKVTPGGLEHGNQFGGRQPADGIVNAPFATVDNIQAGGPEGPVAIGEFASLFDVHPDRYEMSVQQHADLFVGIRHGIQLGAAASAVFEKIQEQRFLILPRFL
jgi:hypothetical protein